MRYLILLYGLFFLPCFSFAQPGDSTGALQTPVLDKVKMLHIEANDPRFRKGKYDLKDYLYVLVDSTGNLDFSDSSSPEYADHFVPLSEVSLQDLSMKRKVFWLRLSIQSSLDQEVRWLTNFMEAKVVLYTEGENGKIQKKQCGVLLPASERYFNKQYGQMGVLPINLPADTSRTYYWHIQSQPVLVETELGIDLNHTLISQPYLSSYLQIDGIVLALHLGFLFAVGIYHLIIFTYNRNLNYLWLFLFCLSAGIASFTNWGYDLQFFWPEMPFAHYYFLRAIVLIIWSLFLILFSRSFLRVPELKPIWDGMLWIVFLLIAAGFGFGTPVLWYHPSSGLILVRLGQNAMIILAFLLMIIPIVCIRKGFQRAKLYLLASTAFLIGFILTMLNTIQVIPRIDHISWIQVGGLIQLSLFAFGLAQLFRQYELERHIAQAEAYRLKELNIIKTRFYTNITHEFRTPLTVISGMADQILHPVESKKLIQRNSNRLLHLINQMLGLAKLETGNLSLKMTQADLVSYLQYLVESFHSFAESRQIQLEFFHQVQNRVMDFDEEKLQSIISNLLSNAIKFSPEGGKINIEVKELFEESKNELTIKVKDSGIGIPDDKLEHIFDSFYQVDDSITRRAEGTGIGLTLTKELVELMGGRIEVQSRLNEGSVFTITLPITRNAPLNEPQKTIVAIPGSTTPVKETEVLHLDKTNSVEEDQPLLLIIEDNYDVITYVRFCLREEYKILSAENGEVGIEKAFQKIPDIIISDVMMPLKDGFEVCATLKNDERTSHIPIILLTAKADIASRIEGLERGADAYLAKPFEKKELLVRLQQLLQLRRRLQERYASGAVPAPSSDKGFQIEDAFLQKIRLLVEENLDDADFGIAELCRALLLSRSQLHRKLKALTNRTTSRVIRTIRLQNAKTLLQSSELTIAEVAYDTGFKDPNHFSRVFKEEFGMTPSELRSQH